MSYPQRSVAQSKRACKGSIRNTIANNCLSTATWLQEQQQQYRVDSAHLQHKDEKQECQNSGSNSTDSSSSKSRTHKHSIKLTRKGPVRMLLHILLILLIRTVQVILTLVNCKTYRQAS